MRRELPTLVLLSTNAVLVALSLVFYYAVRGDLLAVFGGVGEPVPWVAAVALSSWFFPAVIGATGLIIAFALLQSKRGLRLRYLAIAAGVVGTSFLFAALSCYLPILL